MDFDDPAVRHAFFALHAAREENEVYRTCAADYGYLFLVMVAAQAAGTVVRQRGRGRLALYLALAGAETNP